ncbi:MAG: hypothetical protein DRJ69_06380 [Thermoprotei archaeon]|nr:MAG: hypothetical protein DRJ69_06380 [Thermoprotei archaeon]
MAIALASNAITLAMYRIGDAFIVWTAVELNGKLYPPNAGDGPSWNFWVDPDVGPGKPSGYYKPGEPQCGGTADLALRKVDGEGLYVTDSGFLIQVIEVDGWWSDTSYQVKCYGNNLCSRPCREEIGDAWIYVKLDKEKLKGGMPIYVEVSDKSIEDWIKFAESETRVIEKLNREGNDRLRFLGHVEGGEIQQEVPFLWFPENSTLKFKLTGLMKCMQDYGYCGRTIHYYVYIAPPECKMFKPVIKTLTKARTHYGVAYWECSAAAKEKGWKIFKYHDRVCIIGTTWHKTYYKLVEAENTTQPVATTMSKIVMKDETIKTETYVTTMTVNKLIEKTVTVEKTTTKTIGGVKVIETVPGTTVTVKAPKTTYIITDSHQAQAVAEAYQPPKPLTQVIYEKLLEFYYWLLDALGLR